MLALSLHFPARACDCTGHCLGRTVLSSPDCLRGTTGNELGANMRGHIQVWAVLWQGRCATGPRGQVDVPNMRAQPTPEGYRCPLVVCSDRGGPRTHCLGGVVPAPGEQRYILGQTVLGPWEHAMEAGLVSGWYLRGGDSGLIRCWRRGDSVCHDTFRSSQSVVNNSNSCG